MTKLAATFLFGGVLLTFGAVGGMDDPTKADLLAEQLAMAVAGILSMFVGTKILPEEQA